MSEAFTNRVINGAILTAAQGDDLFAPAFTQAAHGFVVGDIVRRSSATAHAKAQADSEANLGVGIGIVVYVTNASTFYVLRASNSHVVNIPSHGLGAFGTTLWLSQGTAGAITATEPASGFKFYVGYVIDANNIHWEPGLKSIEV